MRKLPITLGFAIVFGLVGAVCAQSPVNVVYPINGGTYPIMGPATGPLNAAYITASFSTTCQGARTRSSGDLIALARWAMPASTSS